VRRGGRQTAVGFQVFVTPGNAYLNYFLIQLGELGKGVGFRRFPSDNAGCGSADRIDDDEGEGEDGGAVALRRIVSDTTNGTKGRAGPKKGRVSAAFHLLPLTSTCFRAFRIIFF
jgi:hypothetical protein